MHTAQPESPGATTSGTLPFWAKPAEEIWEMLSLAHPVTPGRLVNPKDVWT